MATETIYISLVSGTTNLYLHDNEGHEGAGTITTDANPRDTVTWKISDAKITSIVDIYAKTGSPDVFSTDPAPNSDGSWTGTIGNSVGEESYGIKYMVDGVEYNDDPKIKVNT